MSNLLLKFDEMYTAVAERDGEHDGSFLVAVGTTGVFCRASCPVKKPNCENISFFENSSDALAAGFKPCQQCQPMEVSGKIPRWLEAVVETSDTDPARTWKDQDIRDCGIDPQRVHRWLLANHGITFDAFLRSRRLGTALSRISLGHDIGQTALDAGYASVSEFQAAFQGWLGCTVGSRKTAGAILVNRLVTPLGQMVIACDEEKLVLLEFADRRTMENQFKRLSRMMKTKFVPGENDLMNEVQTQLNDYFTGSLFEFSIPLFIKGTSFQKSVWNQLLKIDYGKTESYQHIGRKIGKPNAQRAVGKANGDNRIAILIPCHRVIRQNGELSGYGAGVRRKDWLLRHELAVSSCNRSAKDNRSRPEVVAG